MSKFLNPYNFISFPPKKESVYKKDERQCHTGVIHYTVTTKSPLFIPNSSADAVFKQSASAAEHKSYDFFSYTQLSPYTETRENPDAPTPVIPGSEMRGVIRSVYETLTDSCMGVLNSDTLPIKRSACQFEPGLIRKDGSGYTLIQAESFRIGQKAEENELPPGFEKKRNGTLIYFKKAVKNLPLRQDQEFVFQRKDNTDCNRKGYLLKWGMGAGKVRYHLYSPAKKNKKVQVVRKVKLDELETKLISVIESYLNRPPVRESDSEEYRKYK